MNAAVDSGVEAARRIGEVVTSRVIARPHNDIEKSRRSIKHDLTGHAPSALFSLMKDRLMIELDTDLRSRQNARVLVRNAKKRKRLWPLFAAANRRHREKRGPGSSTPR